MKYANQDVGVKRFFKFHSLVKRFFKFHSFVVLAGYFDKQAKNA